MTDIIKIDRYDTKLGKDRQIHYFAIIGKKEIEMPSCYAEMYDEEHLAITERTLSRPEVFDLEDGSETHFIPLFTGPKA